MENIMKLLLKEPKKLLLMVVLARELIRNMNKKNKKRILSFIIKK